MFLDERLLPENIEHITRGHYKEFIELTKVCLGCSYTYTYDLGQSAMLAGCQNASTSFILYVYIKYWFQSPSFTTEVSNDLQMFNDLTTFKKVDNTVSIAALTTLICLAWYLTDDYISINSLHCRPE